MGNEYPNFDDDADEREQDPFKQLRNAERKAQREKKAAEERVAQLEAELSARDHAAKVAEVSSQFGLTQRQTELLLRENENVELSQQLVRSWAAEYGILLANQSEDVETEGEPEGEPIVPVTRSGASPATTRLTYEQWQDLSVNDPKAAVKAVAEGRVDGLKASVGQDGIAQAQY